MNEPSDPLKAIDDAKVTSKHYKWVILASLANFIDAGSIVAGAASASIWVSYFHLSPLLLGIIAALSPNAIAAGIGALVAGPLGDKYGRKTIYTYDMIVYIIGALIIAASVDYLMLLIGYIIVGVAVGVDVPTSWSLIAEISPKGARGRMMAYTNLLWYIGPITILLVGIGTFPLGVDSFRVLFGVLAAVALITWILRRGVVESARWGLVKGKDEVVAQVLKELGQKPEGVLSWIQTTKKEAKWRDIFKYWKGLAFMVPTQICFNIPAGTFGFFLPFLVQALGVAENPVIGNAVQISWFITGIIALVAVYMPLVDKISRKLLYIISALICAIGFALPIFLPFNILWVALLNVLLFGFGHGIGIWPLNTIWSVEIFPTEIRNRAQGFSWGCMRITLGIWSIFVPTIIATIGYSAIAAIATSFLILGILLVLFLAPETHGKSLEEIIKEYYKGKELVSTPKEENKVKQ